MTAQLDTAESSAPTSSRPLAAKRQKRWYKTKAAMISYLFVGPYAILFAVFKIYPALQGINLSFADVGLTGGLDYIGLENYLELFNDPLFWNALRVLIVYTLFAIPLTISMALSVALLASKTIRGVGIYRSIYFLPFVTSGVMGAIIWTWILGTQGPVNWALENLIGTGLPWLQHSILVLFSLALVAAWGAFGYDMLILTAGILAIPNEYYEAAHVDGANSWQRFRSITMPLLLPAMFFVLVLNTVRAFQVFDTIYVMTGGGPVRASYSLTFMIYDQGFGYFNFGYASAAGVVLLVLTLSVSLIQRRLMRQS